MQLLIGNEGYNKAKIKFEKSSEKLSCQIKAVKLFCFFLICLNLEYFPVLLCYILFFMLDNKVCGLFFLLHCEFFMCTVA